MRRIRLIAAVLLVAMAALVPSASADETTFCNAFITSLPYTISTQGHYCFNRNLSTSITSGAAITINADFVVLDLNNFKLGGGAAGLGTDTYGIYSLDRNNLTIRNGNIRGFAIGIIVDSTASTGSQNILVENNVMDGNTKVGINVVGGAVIIPVVNSTTLALGINIGGTEPVHRLAQQSDEADGRNGRWGRDPGLLQRPPCVSRQYRRGHRRHGI